MRMAHLCRPRVRLPSATICGAIAILLFGAVATFVASAAEDDGQADAADPIPDEALLWWLLRHRSWRDLPAAPRPPTVEAAGPYVLTVAWNAPDSTTEIARYDVEYRANGSADFASWEHTDNTTTTMIDGLSPSTVHHVRVRAVNEMGAGDWSPTGQGTTDNAVPEFVEGHAASRSFPENAPAGAAVGAPVAATDPEGGPLRYTLGGEDAGSVDLDAASGQIRTRAGVLYDHETDAELVVTVTVDDGQGGAANIEVTIAVTDVDEPPAAPDAPTVDDSDGEILVVTWTAPDNTGRPPINRYQLRYRGSAGPFTIWNGSPRGTRAEMTGMKPDAYEVQVRGVNDEGEGAWSGSGYGTVSRNTSRNKSPTVDQGLLVDIIVGVGAGETLVPVRPAFSDPDGDALTLSSAADDPAIVTAAISGNNVALNPRSAGSTVVRVTATDPHNASATGTFNVTVAADTSPPPPPKSDPPPPKSGPPAPSLSLNDAETHVTVEFGTSLAANETKAFTVRLRRQDPPSRWPYNFCATASNDSDKAVDETVTIQIPVIGRGGPRSDAKTYLVDYVLRGATCKDSITGTWSATATFTTSGPPTGDPGFDIDIEFVGASDAVKTAINNAVSTWEAAITNDATNVDFYSFPKTNACTNGTFDGFVDDLRVLVRVERIDGAGGVYGGAQVCTYRAGSFPILALIKLDSADVDRIGSAQLQNLALHEMAHTLGFGIRWGGLLVNPSINAGKPPPDTHFSGTKAVAAFNDAGGTSYSGKKVPVENAKGGQGAQDLHWRKSAMGSELMTYKIETSMSRSAITIQSLADLGYTVDASGADSYTLSTTSWAPSAQAEPADTLLHGQCIVYPATDIEFIPDTSPIMLGPSAIHQPVKPPVSR